MAVGVKIRGHAEVALDRACARNLLCLPVTIDLSLNALRTCMGKRVPYLQRSLMILGEKRLALQIEIAHDHS